MRRVTMMTLALCALMLQAPFAHAGSGRSGIDHPQHTNSGVWTTVTGASSTLTHRDKPGNISGRSLHAGSPGVSWASQWTWQRQRSAQPSAPTRWFNDARTDSFLGIDHRVAYDNHGIWNRNIQLDVVYATLATVVGGAFALGDHSKLGDTFWRSLDAVTVSAAAAQVMKLSFQRERPSQTNDPGKFFSGIHNESFPSGEVTVISAAVTPFIVRYGNAHPAVYALAALPLYDAIARVKIHGHWQTDVIAGAALGTLIGIWTSHRQHSLLVGWLPGGFSIGYVQRF